jgi:outer membrane protein, multidrug efflux system
LWSPPPPPRGCRLIEISVGSTATDSYLQVLDAQRNFFRSELDLTTLRRQELASIVELYRALGGSWDQ